MVDLSGKNNAGESQNVTALDCEQWEALLADKMDSEDGMLTPEAEVVFAEHSGKCPGCADLLEQARQGQQWLKLLEATTPTAPIDLLSRILAKTQGAGREADFAIGTGAAAAMGGPAGHAGRWGIPFLPSAHPGVLAARGAHNARMLMTAGMAFFSLALTLSVAGVRLTSVHAAELRPQVVQANVSRSFYGTKKQVVSFYENLRLVYEVESKMHDMRHDSDPAPAPSSTPKVVPRTPPPAPAAPGSRVKPNGAGHADSSERRGKPQQAEPVLYGWALSVKYVQAAPRLLFRQASLGRSQGAGSRATLGGATSKDAISKERDRT